MYGTVFLLYRLRKFDIGREVKYCPTHLDPKAKPQIGILTGWNQWEAFVRFGNEKQKPVACNPHFLTFTSNKRAVGGRGHKVH